MADNVKAYSRHLDLRSDVVFGGVKINPQITRLQAGADVLVATPGRLMDLVQQGAISLDRVEILVLDEADRMLDMRFIRDIKILRLLPAKRQNLLFSATFKPRSVVWRRGCSTTPFNFRSPLRTARRPRSSTSFTPVTWGARRTCSAI